MPTYEILQLPLKPGSDIGDHSNEAAQVLKYVCDELDRTDGCQSIDFGTTVEAWDKIDSHKAFMASEAYQPFRQRFGAMAGGAPTMFHVDLEPTADVLKALHAPVTEFATFYFGDASTEGYLDGAHKFRALIDQAGVKGLHGSAIGLTHEEIEREGVKSKGALLIVGYDSVGEHMSMRELDVFKDNGPALLAGVQKAEVYHVQLMKYAAVQ